MPISPNTPAEPLLPPEMLSRLDALDVISRKILAGKMRGERRSKRRGQSVEFADFRNYVTGDDLRFIDWNIYARLDRLFLKLFLEEEDLSLYVFVDTSGSMNHGNPQKALYAKRVAAALAYVGLVHSNRVNVFGIRDGALVESGPMRGRPRVNRMMSFLSGLTPGGSAELGPMLKRFTLSARLRGVVVVISDFLDKEGFDASLKFITTGRYDLYAIQVLSPEEIDPNLTGDLKLLDAEDASTTEISLSPHVLKQYKSTLNAYCLGLKDYLTRRGGTYLFTSTTVPFDTLVLAYLRKRGLLA
jgi:uncharacterized protein (DUF58 family)